MHMLAMKKAWTHHRMKAATTPPATAQKQDYVMSDNVSIMPATKCLF